MDVRPINCRWPHCADYDESCQTGISIPCIVLEGEHLARERAWANQPCKVMPWHLTNAAVCLAVLIAIGAALYAANAAAGISQ